MTGPKFFAEALAEYEDAVVYYEKREEGLGARLIQEFDEAVAVALEYPEAFAPVPEAPVDFGLRWVILRTFPMSAVACFHPVITSDETAPPESIRSAMAIIRSKYDVPSRRTMQRRALLWQRTA